MIELLMFMEKHPVVSVCFGIWLLVAIGSFRPIKVVRKE